MTVQQPIDPPSEIDKAIELLIALKSARPQTFDQAMARIHASKAESPTDESSYASNLVIGLIKGSFSAESSRMLMELTKKLPRLTSGALGLTSRAESSPASLASRVLRIHGLSSAWTRFFMQAIRDGFMPMDPDCAFDLACRIEEIVEDSDEPNHWLGTPDSYHESLEAFFTWRIDWNDLETQTRFEFLPWILQHWLHEGSRSSVHSAIKSCRALIRNGATSGLTSSSWLEFARLDYDELADEALCTMAECLNACAPLIHQQGLSPCSMFCKLAYPTHAMDRFLRLVASTDPQGPRHIDPDGLSCLYWINARVCQHDSPQWQDPLLKCFSTLVELGSDPRYIAPQLSLSSIANHPKIAAAVEAAEIAHECTTPPSMDGTKTL
jgi:hypothetical protein